MLNINVERAPGSSTKAPQDAEAPDVRPHGRAAARAAARTAAKDGDTMASAAEGQGREGEGSSAAQDEQPADPRAAESHER